MKYILLLRHAKSSHDDDSLKDFDRPLASRGKQDAPRMGKFIKDIAYLPGVVISSPAKRARQTTQLFLKGSGMDQDLVTWNEDLYYGSAGDYLKAIQQLDHPANTVLLVGHNPKMEDIARRLSGDGSIRMATAALACFEQPATRWDQIREGAAMLKWMMIPKVLKQMNR